MPLFVELDGTEHILECGATMLKLLSPIDPIGQCFSAIFELRRPNAKASMAEISKRTGDRFHASPINLQACDLRGIAQPLEAGSGFLINFSFGIGVIDAVRRFELTEADFAPTDLAVEMLYLMEAKSTVAAELLRLTVHLQDAKHAAEEQAFSDPLTGLRNRRALDFILVQLLAAGKAFSLMHIDLDYFKKVNDTLGHAAGDHVLRSVAKILRAQTRLTDTVARVGGDEFVIILPSLCDPDILHGIAMRVIEKLTEPFYFNDGIARISASIGITLSTDYSHPTADRLLCDADDALYSSKRAGRGQLQFANSHRGMNAGPVPIVGLNNG